MLPRGMGTEGVNGDPCHSPRTAMLPLNDGETEAPRSHSQWAEGLGVTRRPAGSRVTCGSLCPII